MTEQPTPSGRDLAREALRLARAKARTQPTTGPGNRRPKQRRAERGTGRDPVRFDGLLEHLAAAYNWKRPSAGGTLMANWARIAPDYAAHATPEHYDPDTRTLHLRPDSPAAATRLRLETRRILDTLNAALGQDAVGHLRVLVPGYGRTTTRPDHGSSSTPGPAVEPESVEEPRRPAPAAYRQAIGAVRDTNAHRAAQAAAEQQRLEELRVRYSAPGLQLREPEAAFVEARTELAEQRETAAADADWKRTALEAARAAARNQQAGQAPAVPRAFDPRRAA